MASGLILVDVQNEYFPGGRMELTGIRQASANAGQLLALWLTTVRSNMQRALPFLGVAGPGGPGPDRQLSP